MITPYLHLLGWSRVFTLSHPELLVRITTDEDDYAKMGFLEPIISPKYLDVITDSGAQSCLWSRKEYLSSGFSMKDLIPVVQLIVYLLKLMVLCYYG